MSANVFENWFLEKLIPNLPEKSVVILDNASYHCRQVDKIPNMNTRKTEILDFMKRITATGWKMERYSSIWDHLHKWTHLVK